MIELLTAVGSIILIDLVLSGDNALVIGAAAAGLPRRQRWYAIVLGGGGAIVFRVVFASIATLLLRFPLLQAVGGLLLLFIAVRLLMNRGSIQHTKPTERGVEASSENMPSQAMDASVKRSFLAALLTIVVADVTMSLDNVLAIGALASGNLALLSVGLLLSIALVLIGGALVAELIERFSWLMDVAALVLAWTAAKMVLDDIRLGPILEHLPWTQLAIPVVAFGVVIAADLLLRLRDNQRVTNKNAL